MVKIAERGIIFEPPIVMDLLGNPGLAVCECARDPDIREKGCRQWVKPGSSPGLLRLTGVDL